MIARAKGTRSGIMGALKRHGRLTATEIGQELRVSSMAARQHLAVLEAEDLVESELRRAGIGRPSEAFRLTVKGDETFPRFYDEFLLSILRSVKAVRGDKGLREIIDCRAETICQMHGDRLWRQEPRERVMTIFRLLGETGHLPELEDTGSEVVIIEYNCPIALASREFPEICRSELILMQRLVRIPVERDRCMAEGADNVCRYRFTIPSQ